MKMKCPKCGTGKARRICHREGNAEICSQCCASIRSPECGDCVHYEATNNYEARRIASSGVSRDGEFLVEINPELTEKINNVLDSAQRGNDRKAMDILTGLLREHPHNHEVAFGIGFVHASRNEFEKAVEWFDKAIAIYPYSTEAYFNKAVAHRMLAEIPDCIRAYRKVVAMGDPAAREVVDSRKFLAELTKMIGETAGIPLDEFLEAADHFDRSFALMEKGKYQEALEGFQASAAINERNPSCHGNTGLCYASLGQKANALAEFERALEIDPKYLPAIGNRKVVEKMTEGTPLENVTHQSINSALEDYRG